MSAAPVTDTVPADTGAWLGGCDLRSIRCYLINRSTGEIVSCALAGLGRSLTVAVAPIVREFFCNCGFGRRKGWASW
jgi:hypothetical protein